MAALFTLISSNLSEINDPVIVAVSLTLNSKKPNTLVSIKAPVHGVLLKDAAGLTFVPPPQVMTVQLKKQQAKLDKVKGLTPANFLREMSDHSPKQVDWVTNQLFPNEQFPPPIKDGDGVHVYLS